MTKEKKMEMELIKRGVKICDDFDKSHVQNPDADYNFNNEAERRRITLEVETKKWEQKIKRNAAKAQELADRSSVLSAKRLTKKYINSRKKVILSKIGA